MSIAYQHCMQGSNCQRTWLNYNLSIVAVAFKLDTLLSSGVFDWNALVSFGLWAFRIARYLWLCCWFLLLLLLLLLWSVAVALMFQLASDSQARTRNKCDKQRGEASDDTASRVAASLVDCYGRGGRKEVAQYIGLQHWASDYAYTHPYICTIYTHSYQFMHVCLAILVKVV